MRHLFFLLPTALLLLASCQPADSPPQGESGGAAPGVKQEAEKSTIPEGAKVSDLKFPVDYAPTIPAEDGGKERVILFLTDDGEHGWMEHENTAGAILLGKRLAKALPGCRVRVFRDQFPDEETLVSAAGIVLFSSGTERHLLNTPERLAAMRKAMDAGVGLAAFHWALEAGDDEGSAFLRDCLGGVFELNYSVNPMWLAKFKKVGQHEATRGVSPYEIYDEFYFNIRLPELPGKRVTLLDAVPPKRVVLMPKDGPRSNNPVVRASNGKPHVISWVYERPSGGRAFGFTGGHFHWDWKQDDQRQVVLNGIAWISGFSIPEGGVPNEGPSEVELFDYQDSPPKKGWKPMPGQPKCQACE